MIVTTISPQMLAELCKKGKKIDLIDVRTPVEYREVHVELARNVPLDRLEAASMMEARNGKEEPLYLICRSGSRGRQACEKFLAAGFTNVVNVEGGTLA
jgi:rhodanese-related sulfurtransferase